MGINRVDPKSGFDPETKTYQSLRPKIPLPPISTPLSITSYALSLLQTQIQSKPSKTSADAFIDASTGRHVSYSVLVRQIQSLSSAATCRLLLRRGDTALILSPSSLEIPALYLSLMAVGVAVAPANPIGSDAEIARQIGLTRPKIVFAVSSVVEKVPKGIKVVVLDSPEFVSMLCFKEDESMGTSAPKREEVQQEDTAAILFSSGTTGKVKGVEISHRSLIAIIAGYNAIQRDETNLVQQTSLFILPMFHVFGFFMIVRSVALGETVVVMERFDLEKMFAAVERFKVTYMPASPPLVVAMVKSEAVQKYDLSSLQFIGSGGAPLAEDVAVRFRAKFPNVEITQGYGLTETAGSVSRTIELEESMNVASVGKLCENIEAKIVDPVSGQPLPPGQPGELCLRGPFIMKGYVGDEKATAETLDSEGWLKTGDLCMFDSEGFLYIVDRLKELIKYKAYQVPPAELEHLLLSHPDITDAAVIPYPDEDAGEIPMAYVVRKQGSNLSEAQVIDFVSKKVAPYKKVRRVAFIDAIPKSPAGKILRRELINHALPKKKSKL